MDVKTLSNIVVHTLQSWLLTQGITPSLEWDAADHNCFRASGEHLIWTVQGKALAPFDEYDMSRAFDHYFTERNKLPGAVPFYPYMLQRYECPCGCGTYVYASVYQ